MKYVKSKIPVFNRYAGLALCTLLFFVKSASANNLQITNVSVLSRNTALNYSIIRFDISWENSWRISSGPANWDAAWVFIKYRIKTQSTWKHATLNWVNGNGNSDGHSVPTGSVISSSNDNGSGSHGVFIYHSSAMVQSAVSYNNVELRWNYGVDGVHDNDNLEICVFGIEMVRVSQGSFYIGDSSPNVVGQFHDASNNVMPYLVSSESALTLGGIASGSVGNNNSTNMFEGDDFNDGISQILPAPFPKGFKAYYCMKYEITQSQYVNFLNKLSYEQQKTRTNLGTPPESAIGTNVLTFFGGPYRNGIVIQTPGSYPGTPAVYACNVNGNNLFNEVDDGHTIACNNISWADVTAYLDWTALRPMTEFEYEKACRGPITPVPDEFAWGNSSFNIVPGTINDGRSSEVSVDPNANCHLTDWTAMNGPVRVGCLGIGGNTRIGSGATYYGIMEMSGNVWERVVSIGNVTGRAFTGLHGDGTLSNVYIPGVVNNGDANVPGWPDNTSAGSGLRGGSWNFFDPMTGCVSNRMYATSAQSFPLLTFGGRGVRTAPY